MERLVTQVKHDKTLFFKNIITNFDLAEIITEESILEPKTYPSADLELR